MKLGFEEAQTAFVSASQQARVWTERWVADWMFCPNCGAARLNQFPANSPVADFFCQSCSDQFEVKSKNGKSFGKSVADGAYDAKIARLSSKTNPNLLLLGYSKLAREVHNVCIVPKHFFVPDIIQKRKPLAETARRKGWVGSNILLANVPEAGRIFVLRNGVVEPKDQVLAKWKETLFLRRTNIEARGWLLEVMKAVDLIGRPEFDLDDVYSHEARLSAVYPNNNNVRPKIRQQLQVLRDNGYLEFVGKGHYRLRAGRL
ncbi:MAG TPA: DpnI domain-containing protein [Devosia sp.]|nr:DpnI domain-containing protein [Devosia sp.]